ncbi:MAG: RibD family protein [Sulfurifustis sp.]
MDAFVDRLYPFPAARLPLSGLYLAHRLRERGTHGRPYIYSNFIASLDGRISERDPRTQRRVFPRVLRHPHDWHAYLELAAQADAVVLSGRRLRELGAETDTELRCMPDLASGPLADWRRQHGLRPQPACIVLTSSFDLPIRASDSRSDGEIIVVTGAGSVGRAQSSRFEIISVPGPRVSGDDVYRLAVDRGFWTVYAISGPDVFNTLMSTGRIDRLYLTLSLQLIGGREPDTLLHGDALTPPPGFALHELYLDTSRRDLPGLLLASLDHEASPFWRKRNTPD